MSTTASETSAPDFALDCPKCISDFVVNSMRAQVERTPDEDMTRLSAWADRVEAGAPEGHSEHSQTQRKRQPASRSTDAQAREKDNS